MSNRPNGVTVINIMADGSVCDDLSTYVGAEHPLPELTVRLLKKMLLNYSKKQEPESG